MVSRLLLGFRFPPEFFEVVVNLFKVLVTFFSISFSWWTFKPSINCEAASKASIRSSWIKELSNWHSEWIKSFKILLDSILDDRKSSLEKSKKKYFANFCYIYFSKFCQKMVMMIFQKIYLGISSVMQERTVRNNIPHPADFISFQFVFEDLMVAKRLRVRPTAFWQFFSTYNWLIWCPNILLNKRVFFKSVNQKFSYIIYPTLSFSLG